MDHKNNDIELVNLIKNKGCSTALKELTEKHVGIIYSVAKKYVKSCGIDLNEIHDNRYWLIYTSCLSFNEDKKTKFSTWLGNQVRFFCLNFRKKESKFIFAENSILDYFDNQNNDSNSNKQKILDNIIDIFNSISDPNTKKAIYYRYFYNNERILNYSEIADILKVTPQTVLNWHNKFIKFAKKKLTQK